MIRAFRAFGVYARRYRGLLALGAGLAVLEVLIRLAEPWPLRIIVDHVLADDPAPFMGISDPRVVLAWAVLSLLGVVAVAALLDYWSTRILTSAGLRLATDLRGAVFTHLHRLSLGYHGRQQVGDLSTRVTSDVDKGQDMIVQALAVIGPNVMLVVGMFSVMMAMDPEFTLLALALTPLLAWAVHRSTVQLKDSSRRARKADGQVAAATTESLGLMNLVQAFSLERTQRDRFDSLTRWSLKAGLESARVQARFSPMVDVTAALSATVILWFGSSRVLSGELTLGMLLVFLSYLGSLYKPMKALSKLSTTFAKGTAAVERVQDVLMEQPDIVDRPGAVMAHPFRGEVEFRSVAFSYGETEVLHGIDLRIEAGETVALVGPTGAGKSTMVSLVPRLIDAAAGAVLVDGQDVRDYQLHSLRSQIALVLQDCVLLRGTLRDNIMVGDPDADEAAVLRAVRLSLVDEFAGRLPLGLDTPVGERGASLSGGQRQRIAIARAILRDAPILILDEPTSALDTRSEEHLVEALANLPANRTTLLIAHRLSTVRRADRVAVVEDGRLIQLGSPADLLDQEGLYRQLSRAGAIPDGSRPRPLQGSKQGTKSGTKPGSKAAGKQGSTQGPRHRQRT